MRREWLIRALRTFVQAALGFAAANAAGIIGDGDGLTRNALAALTVASVAAGLAALMNLPALSALSGGGSSSAKEAADAQTGTGDRTAADDPDTAYESREDADE